VLNSVIDYTEKDLEKRQEGFDELLKNVDFKTVKKTELKKLYSKKKWIQKSKEFQKVYYY
jgi:hypothetical protein